MKLIPTCGVLPDGRAWTQYAGSGLRWLGPYPCEASEAPHKLGPTWRRPDGAVGMARPILAGCEVCGLTLVVGWEPGPVFFTDRDEHARWLARVQA